MYEVLQSTALSQNDALLSLLNVLTQMLEAQKQLKAEGKIPTNTTMRWGADWDNDGKPRERGESDSPHFEI